MKHVKPNEGTRERRIQEQMLICGTGPVAGPPSRKRQVLGVSQKSANSIEGPPGQTQANEGIV